MKRRLLPVIRVFVSSTFSDLKEERNVLQGEVFPQLEHYCLVRGFQFQAIDLRWGVPGEAGRDHRTMQICFDELRRAQEISPRPNFLVLLGDRYGWRPLAEKITEAEFLELDKAAAQLGAGDGRASPAGERAVKVLRTWYRRDDNADPVAYVLRSRKEWPDGQLFSAERENVEWQKVEAVLWAVVNRAFPREGLAGRFRHNPGPDDPLPSIVRFQASATEQEIWSGALAVPDAPEHVVVWCRTIRNRRQFLGDDRAREFFDSDPSLHTAAEDLRDQLQNKIRPSAGNIVQAVEVDLRPSGDSTRLEVTCDHIPAMRSDIEKRLLQVIEREIREYWHPTIGGAAESGNPRESISPSEARMLELEQLAHEQFGESRAPRNEFIGRANELRAIATYLSDEPDRHPLVVYGPSGTGKTALLARAAQLATDGRRRPIVRFLGTTSQSSSLRDLLTNLCRVLRAPDDSEKKVPSDLRELQNEFDQLLASATEDEPILLFLDALDQLDEADGAREAHWLRTPLPEHVKVVVSCIYDGNGPESLNEPYRALERRKLLDRGIAVESLTGEEAMTLLALWLQKGDRRRGQRRCLTDGQRAAIAARITPPIASACRRPFYLRVLFEECRLWPSYTPKSPADLGDHSAALLQGLFDRLSSAASHGRILVEAALGYLASARHGLSESEILEILLADSEYKQHLDAETKANKHELPVGATRIPIAIWSRLRHDLEPFLAEHSAPGGVVLSFYHREVGRAATDRFLGTPALRCQRHGRLAEYFRGDRQPWWRTPDFSPPGSEPATPRLPNARRASELPWQLLRTAEFSDPAHEQSAVWNDPVAILCDIEFVEVKCFAGLVFELQEDYRAARKALPETQKILQEEQRNTAEIARWTEEITRYSSAWSERRDRTSWWRRPREAEPLLPVPPVACRIWEDSEIGAERERINKAPTRIDRLDAFAGFVTGEYNPLAHFGGHETFTLQHATNYSPGGPVNHAASGRLSGCGGLLLLRRWPSRAVWIPRPALLRTLEDRGMIYSVSLAPDGRRAVSASDDHALRVWGLESGACLLTLAGHSDSVMSVSVTPNGRRAVSGSVDRTLRVWNMESGACLRTLIGHSDAVLSVSVTPDGRRAVSGSKDHSLRVWDLENGKCLRELKGHGSWVQSVGITPDGRLAFSGGNDHTLRLWDLERWKCLGMLKGHDATVSSVSLTPDGRRVLSGKRDDTIRVWDFVDVKLGTHYEDTLNSGYEAVQSVCMTPDGRLAASGGFDRLVRVWGTYDNAVRRKIFINLRHLKGHSEYVNCVSVTPDGRRAVSGSADKTLRMWDLERGDAKVSLANHVYRVSAIALTPDGRRAVSASYDGELRVWDLESRDCVRTLAGHRDAVISVSVTPDGRRAVSASYDKTLRVWDLEGDECLRTNEGAAWAILTPDGRRVVAGSGDKDRTIRVWDLESWTCLKTLDGSGSPITLTPDGRRAVAVGTDNAVDVWELESEAAVLHLRGHGGEVSCISVSPDGRRAVSGSMDHTLRVWNLESGACLRTLQGNNCCFASVSVTPDGHHAVSVSSGANASVDSAHLLQVWDLESGACVRTIGGHSARVRGLIVMPDGQCLVSWSDDKTLRAWDFRTGDCLGIFYASAPVTDVALASGCLVIGTDVGQVLFVEMRNLPSRPMIKP